MSSRRRDLLALGLALSSLLWAGPSAAGGTVAAPEVVRIWPGKAPTAISWSGAETAVDTPTPGGDRKMHVISNVTAPSLSVFRPARGQGTGAAMVVLPGGAFGALAWDLEGTEVARWLADRGVTAFVLKYRVGGADPAMAAEVQALFARPAPDTFDRLTAVLEPRRRIAVEDALQAVRTIRSQSARFGVAADRIGMIGFSAGAMTTMGAVLEGDAASRPDFAAPIYGAMKGDSAPKGGPPLFLVHAEDDPTVPVGKSLQIFQAWQRAGLPAELHVYPTGGHGFGLGRRGTAAAAWPQAFETWLVARKIARPAAPTHR